MEDRKRKGSNQFSFEGVYVQIGWTFWTFLLHLIQTHDCKSHLISKMLQIYCSQKRKKKTPEVSDLSRHLVSPLLMPCQTWTAAISTSFMLEGVLPSLWTSEGEVGLCPGCWLCLEADLLAWGTTKRASEWVFVVLSVTLLDEIQETMNNKFFSGTLMRCCTCCTMTRCSSYLYIPASAKNRFCIIVLSKFWGICRKNADGS